MELETHIIKGPLVAKMSKEAAEKKLAEHPDVSAGASMALREIEGRWYAAVTIPKKDAATKQSAPPPFEPKDEGASDEGGSSDGPPSDDEGDGPPDEGDGGPDGPPDADKGAGALEHQVQALVHMMTKLMGALGLDQGPEGPMGHEAPPGPEGPPNAMDHDPATPGDQGPDGKTHTVHERALKPGESPPGTTPVGSPAFASVRDDHPWKEYLGVKRTFVLQEPIGDQTMASVRSELRELEAEVPGYKVKRAKEGLVDGVRVARVLVQADAA